MSRPPNYEFQEWWSKQQRENHPDLFPPTDHRHLTVENQSPAGDRTVDKDRHRSARQLSWLALLKLQQISLSPSHLSANSLSLHHTATCRLTSAATPTDATSPRLYRAIKTFLVIVLILLVLELGAYNKGWHFSPPRVRFNEVVDFVELCYAKWIEVRAEYLAPALQGSTNICVVLFLVLLLDLVVLVLGCFWIKFRRLRPVAEMEFQGSEEMGDYPIVLVQIPMCNEREAVDEQNDRDPKRCETSENKGIENDSTNKEEKDENHKNQDDVNTKPPEPPKDYIHVRARSGQATNPHSLAERVRREKISERMKFLQDLVPGCNKVTGKAHMLDEITNYVQSLQRQVEFLSMKLASVNTVDFNTDSLLFKDVVDKQNDPDPKRYKTSENKGIENDSTIKKEKDENHNNQDDANTKPPEPPKDYIHVRARRGQATDSHSLAERIRREKISERMKLLQDLVPGCNKVTGKALMLDEIINYVQSLQRQVEFLSMKLASVNTVDAQVMQPPTI